MSAPARVLLLTGVAVPGGLHRHLALLAEGLLRRGLEVHVVMPPEAPASSLTKAGASVTRLHAPGRRDLARWRALRTIVVRAAADVVHVHLSSPVEMLPALLAVRAAGARRIVTTEHAPTWSPLRRPWSASARSAS